MSCCWSCTAAAETNAPLLLLFPEAAMRSGRNHAGIDGAAAAADVLLAPAATKGAPKATRKRYALPASKLALGLPACVREEHDDARVVIVSFRLSSSLCR